MELALQGLMHAGEALLKAALNPFACLGWLLLALSCRRRTELERKLFAVRLHAAPGEWLRGFGAGLAAALAVSLAAFGLGLRLSAEAVLWTWAVVLALLPLRLRLANLPAAAAVIGLLQPAVRPLADLPAETAGTPAEPLLALLGTLKDSLLAIDVPSLWMLAALLLLAQAVLVRATAARGAMPLYVPGKRGKAIGAYQLQGLWLLPLALFVPGAGGTAGGAAAADAAANTAVGAVESAAADAATGALSEVASAGGPPWWLAWFTAQPDAGAGVAGGLAAWLPWPLPFGDGAADGWLFLAFPALIGFADMTASALPDRKAVRLAWRHAAWAAAFGAAAVAARFWPAALPAAAALAALLPETWQLWAARAERRRSPQFVHAGRGLRVLDVLPQSPAAEMGIVRGETVVKANGLPVETPDGLHAALRSNPAFSRLEVVDLNGQNRFVQRSLYSGEHHLLGLMLCPDDRVPEIVPWRPLTLWQLLRIRTRRHRSAAWETWPGPAEPGAESAQAAGDGHTGDGQAGDETVRGEAAGDGRTGAGKAGGETVRGEAAGDGQSDGSSPSPSAAEAAAAREER